MLGRTHERKARLAEALPPVVVLADGWASGAADVVAEAPRVWAAGGEGVMVKDAEAPYRRNRSDAWLKVKRENMHRWAQPLAARPLSMQSEREKQWKT